MSQPDKLDGLFSMCIEEQIKYIAKHDLNRLDQDQRKWLEDKMIADFTWFIKGLDDELLIQEGCERGLII